jgi:tetratricopeptide (TPR) repeat protein
LADPRTRPRLKSKGALAGFAAIALAAAVFVPMIVRTATSFDMAQHFDSEDVRRQGGLLAAAVRPARLIDLLDLVFLFTPLGVLSLVFLPKAGAREIRVALVLALSWGALAFVLFPAQGAFRDWDVFAPAGVALAILAGALAARAAGEWLAAVPVVCLAGALLVLGSAHDREGTWRRAEAFMAGPPERTPVERAKTWEYLGSSWFQAGRYADAARAFGREAETSRSQRVYLQWAIAANHAQDDALTRRVLEELVTFAPGTALAWQQLGALAWQQGDYATAARAARALAKLAPDNSVLQRNAQDIERFYEAWRDSANARR